MPSTIKLITGLGNPNSEHLMTRHNAGFWFVDILADKYSLVFRPETRLQSEICRLNMEDFDCWLAKPMTYMNKSGSAVRSVAGYYKITIEEILVIHDDIDLPAGDIRLKQGGGHGGHNGLRDIIEHLGSGEFTRLRIGVGHPGDKDLVTPYLLKPASKEDCIFIMEAITSVLPIMPDILAGEFMKAMNQLHTKQSQVTSNKSQESDKNE